MRTLFLRFWINECDKLSYQPNSCQIQSLKLQIIYEKWLKSRDLATTAQWGQRCTWEWRFVVEAPCKGFGLSLSGIWGCFAWWRPNVSGCHFSRMPRIKQVTHYAKLIKNASVLYTYISCLLSNCGLPDTSEQFEFNRILPSWINF